MKMDRWEQVVSADGYLIPHNLSFRESLYQGMNGRHVERFKLASDAETSYIFKPVTQAGQAEREVWVYENVLPMLPEIYPRLLARSLDPAAGWMIYEDLGPLSHDHGPEDLNTVIEAMAQWHRLPTDSWIGARLVPPKPRVEAMAGELLQQEAKVAGFMKELHLPGRLLGDIAEISSGLGRNHVPLVLSHGDLHAGNYTRIEGRLYVLDWEHVHLNTPYWDLYHVLDMSHPIFPRKAPLTHKVRDRLLRRYWQLYAPRSSDASGRIFAREYYLFAMVFSLWMLLLIDKDLSHGGGPWSSDQLRIQQEETKYSVRSCACSLMDSDKAASGGKNNEAAG